jgi:hypothetical protein
MGTSSLVLLIAVAAICLVVTPTTSGHDGGWFPLPDINDPHVQELGGWAVVVHNGIDKDALVFKRVVSGQYQVMAGIKYNLTIKASNPDGKVCNIFVCAKLDQHASLT